MTDKTVAVDSEVAPPETTTGQGAPDELDAILSSVGEEFDKETKPPVSEPKKTDEVAELRSRVEYLVSQSENGDIDKAVDSVSKTLEVQVPRKAIKGYLNEMAIEDPRIQKAFQNRHKDPVAWNKVLKAASKRINDDFKGLPDKALTDDREALAATIRGASKTSTVEDEAPNFSGWSDNRFNHWKMYGKDNPNL